ncbi:MAG: MBOAT family O-acyltransferase [Planctomycetota bacterium]
MLFTEARFLLFFILAFCLYWMLRRNVHRKVWLLICSYIFYAAWDWRFLSLICVSTMVDYIAGAFMSKREGRARRKPFLMASLFCNLVLLGFFKYFNFFYDSTVEFLQMMGFSASSSTLEIILPVGISFYTFQTLSYTIDIYRGKLKPVDSLLDFALFVGFFPQLVAGPIVRASEFLPQLLQKHKIRDVAFRACLTLFLFGYIKKACVADNFALIVDPIFADPNAYSTLVNWLALFLYGVQIYCDFSGYSDMAIATAGLLGYQLPLNFDFPYLTRSITDFWRHWHISLSSWFRDYVYIPMGGDRRGVFFTYFNLITVFFLCGLWHGARWNFVLFGLYHGVFLVLERATGFGRIKPSWRPLQYIYTVFVSMSAWAVFRNVDLASILTMWKRMFGFGGDAAERIPGEPIWFLALAGFAVIHVAMKNRFLHKTVGAMPDWLFYVVYGAAVGIVLPFAAAGYKPFIYFQF